MRGRVLKMAQAITSRTHYRLITGALPDPELLLQLQAQWSSGILHIGGHHGQEAHWYGELGKPVLWIEAMPDAAALIEMAIAPFSKQAVIQACLSDSDGSEVTFYVSSNSEGASSSLFEFGSASVGPSSMWPDLDLRMVDEIQLTTITLDTLLRSQSVDVSQYDHWIVDIQGAELLALSGAVSSLRSCRSLVVESSSIDVYAGGAQWKDVRRFLAAHGFVPLWDCLGHMDVLFVRQTQQWMKKLV